MPPRIKTLADHLNEMMNAGKITDRMLNELMKRAPNQPKNDNQHPKNTKTSRQPIDLKAFLEVMMKTGKLPPQVLLEIQAKNIGNKLQDNAGDYLGMTKLGSGTGVVLGGELATMAGTIDDIRAQISEKIQEKYHPDTPQNQPKDDNNLTNTPKFKG